MSVTIDAVYENGVLRPLGPLQLSEHQHVRVIVDVSAAQDAGAGAPPQDDPLVNVRAHTGIADLAEHFGDYRFGRRLP
jgi:hypothetical protein